MDWLQGPIINPSCQLFGEHLDHHHQAVEWSEEAQGHPRFEQLEYLDEEKNMPFLHMLQSFETPPSPPPPTPFLPSKEPTFQALLRLQHLKRNSANDAWEFGTLSHEIIETQIKALGFQTNGMAFTNDSPVKSEEFKDHREVEQLEETQKAKSSQVTREKRKRKRTRPSKNKEEVESQRMTHIAVERNRRRQMNEHLSVLRSLMPKTYVQRGDQASIVGGAIDFVKELEQLVHSLEAQKRMRVSTQLLENNNSSLLSSSSSNSSSTISSCSSLSSNNGLMLRSESKTETADIEATVIQTHVNLKVQCPKRRPGGQLLKAIVALEDLKLTILHLNIASSHDTILYSFNLKIEDGCKLRSADEISGAVHRIFRIIDES